MRTNSIAAQLSRKGINMGYGKKIYDAAISQLEQRRRLAEENAWRQLDSFYAKCPRAMEIKSLLASNAARAAKAVIGGGDVKAQITALKEKGLALTEEYNRLLSECGLSQEDIEPKFFCRECKDTGYVNGRPCQCLRQLQRLMAYEKLSLSVPLEKSSFDSFSLEYYKNDPRAYQQMSNVLRVCKEYAQRFRSDSSSLLFKGGTGLGKTHLSLAIAGTAIEKGFGVIYGSAQSFAVSLEKERFDRTEPEDLGDTHSQLLSCDLLILDDLGTEFPSNYVNAALYNIVNTRMLAEKPTIISTNLSMKELEDRYSERFASRITGYYGKLEFLGEDVRVRMRTQKNNYNQ